MRRLRPFALFHLLTAIALAQQAPFVTITDANAPKGGAFLLAARRGGLWLGGMEAGSESLTYFDGVRFVSPIRDFPKITVSGMAEDTDGGLWLASVSGIYRVFQGKAQKQLNDSAPHGIVRIAEDVFLAAVSRTARETFRCDVIRIAKFKGEWRLERLAGGLSVGYMLNPDRSGNVLYPCPGGYCEWRARDIVNWREGQTLASSRHAFLSPKVTGITQFYRDTQGCVWFGDWQNGAAFQCPGDVSATTLAQLSVGPRVLITEMKNGDIVIATPSRMLIGRPGRWRVITPATGYQVPASILPQDDGTLWMQNGKGLYAFPTQARLEFWSERDGLDGLVWSILPYQGAVFAASGDDIRMLSSDRSRWRQVVHFPGSDLLPGPGTSLLVSSESRGVAQMTVNGQILRASPPQWVERLAQTQDGQIWAGGNPLARVSLDGRSIHLAPSGAPARTPTWDLALDSSGGLWSCSAEGLIHKDASNWHPVTTANGLIKNGCRCLAADHDGDIWYAYDGMDTASFSWIHNPASEKPVMHHFAAGAEIGTAMNNFIHADHRGWLWRGAEDGLYIATLPEARAGRWLFLNRSDGLPSPDTNQHSVHEDQDGSMWFGMGTNIVHFSPAADLLTPDDAPSVFFSGYSFNDGIFHMSDSAPQVGQGQTVVAHIGSLRMDRRNAIRLRYRLTPDQADWKLTRNLDIALGKLPPGNHTLEVQARLLNGPWSRTVRRTFSVLKPFWLQWPAILGLAMAGGGTALGATMSLRRRRRKLQAELPVLIRLRKMALERASRLEGCVLDGRFEVGRFLETGGFATVFQGRDRRNGNRPCAVKIFHRQFSDKQWIERRFRQEVSALTRICHPNVVRIYGHGTAADGAPYLAMEFIEGQTLRDLLGESRLKRSRVASYLRQTGEALGEIHAHGVCHRDLKPENLMIRAQAAPGEEIVLIDFSIAIVKDPDKSMHGLTRAAGTLLYMAPEQAVGYADPSSDIYSLAKVLLEMLTGKRLSALFPEASLNLPAHVREFFAASPLGLSAECVGLIADALEFDPSHRPHDARLFARRIARDLER